MRKLLAIVCLVAGIFSTRVDAATITVNAPDDFGRTFIDISGDINLGDDDAFKKQTQYLTANDVIVSLVSRGGNPLSAMQIGEWVHRFGWGTYVPSNAICASACALIWISGVPRTTGTPSYIGFHAVSDSRTGEEIGYGNAVVGAYLSKLGFSYDTVICATTSSPDEMWWLTVDRPCGITWVVLNPVRGSRQPQTTAVAPTPQDQRFKDAVTFVAALEAHESSAGSSLGGSPSYADVATYYGKQVTRDAILADKQAFAARWTERRYIMMPDTEAGECHADATCFVTGLVSFEAYNANRWSRGVASYSFTLQVSGKDFIITGEDGAIVQRRTNRDDALSPEAKQEIARKQWLAVAWDFKQRLENYLIQHPSECGMHDPFGFTISCSKRNMGSQQATADITGGIQTAPSAHTTMDLHLRVAPDPLSADVLGLFSGYVMPNGSQVTITDRCQVWNGSGRGAQDADNIWCPVVYADHSGWANAFFLVDAVGNRIACLMYPRSNGCVAQQ
jgi:hypothetical protein